MQNHWFYRTRGELVYLFRTVNGFLGNSPLNIVLLLGQSRDPRTCSLVARVDLSSSPLMPRKVTATDDCTRDLARVRPMVSKMKQPCTAETVDPNTVRLVAVLGNGLI